MVQEFCESEVRATYLWLTSEVLVCVVTAVDDCTTVNFLSQQIVVINRLSFHS
jgi:hypothetical protein